MKRIISVLVLLALTTPALASPFVRIQEPPQNQSSTAPLTNKDVLDMLKAGLAANTVVAKINSSSCQFDTSPAALADLKAASVPEGVILAMVQASSRSSVTAPTVKQDRPNGVEVVVPDGTPLTVITLEEISSKTASEGDALTFKVDEDVVVNGHIVIAKGTIAKATVSEVQKSGHLGKSGKLGIRLEQTATVDGQRIKLRASKGKEGDDKTGSVILLSLFISPLFLLKKGSSPKIKPGTKISAYTDEEKKVIVSGAQ